MNGRNHKSALVKKALRRTLIAFAVIVFLKMVSVAQATISNGENAIDIIGQYTTTAGFVPKYNQATLNNNNGSVYALGFSTPSDALIDSTNHRLFVSEYANNRVLVFNLDTNDDLIDKVPDFVLGQTNFTSNTPAVTQAGMHNPRGFAYDDINNRLFVSDKTNNRVLIYDVTSITNGENAIAVLGQANFTSSAAATTRAGMSAPSGLAYDNMNDRLFVADSVNSRVTVFDVSSIVNGENAMNVLGQPNYTTSTSATTIAKMSGPIDAEYDSINNRLFVSELTNNRVTVFDVASITNGENAVNVLGEPDFTTYAPAVTQASLIGPRNIFYDSLSKRLFVPDYTNNRVMVFDVASITNGENAINVLGRPDFTTNAPAVNQANMDGPIAVAFNPINGKLYVVDTTNNRITVYDAIPLPQVSSITSSTASGNKFTGSTISIQVNFDTAVVVSGTPQLTLETGAVDRVLNYVSGSGTKSLTFNYVVQPGDTTDRLDVQSINALSLNGGTINDTSGNVANIALPTPYSARSLGASSLFKINPNLKISNGKSAFDLLGEYSNTAGFAPNYTQATVHNNNGSTYRYGFSAPYDLALDSGHHRLFISDFNNNRVLVFNLDTNNNLIDKIPDAVLGQPNLGSNAAATTQAGMSGPVGLAYDSPNERLFVGQIGNQRVSVFNVAGINNGENAAYVLGQPNFTTSGAAATQAGMDSPVGLAYDQVNSRLFVANNNRVTVYDVASITNGENAVNVLGQANFTSSAAATTQAGMSGAYGLAYDSLGERLFVQESSNNRVTVYDVASITNGENAVNVLGQANFTSNTAATTQAGMSGPRGLAYDSANKRLFVSGNSNNRVSVFDVNSITDGENAVNVLGQANFTSNTAATTQAGMSGPRGMAYDSANKRLFVSDTNNNRVTVYDVDDSYLVWSGNFAESVANDGSVTGSRTMTFFGDTFTSGVSVGSDFVQGTHYTIANLPAGLVATLTKTSTTLATLTLSGNAVSHMNANDVSNLTITFLDGAFSNNGIVANVSGYSNNSGVIDFDDNPTFTVSESAGATSVTEAGAADTFSVVLDVQPSSNVVFSITPSDPTSFAVSSTTITFTSVNWNIPQTISVTAINDSDIVNETGTIVISVVDASSDDAWDSIGDQTININVTDDDIPNVTANSSSINIADENGGTNTFTVVLGDQPTGGNVVIDISSSDTSEATVSPVQLTFNSANWNIPQTVTLTAINDNTIPNGAATISLDINDGLSTADSNAWDGVVINDVSVTIANDDSLSFTVTESAGSTNVTEGAATDSFTVFLDAQPLSDVVFSVTTNDPSVTISSSTLTFTTANWNIPQTIVVTSVQDANAINESPVVTIAVNDSLSEDYWDALPNQTVNVSVSDDDLANIAVSPSSINIASENGGTSTFTVVLGAQPVAGNVVVDISSSDTSVVTSSVAQIIFNSVNWNIPQTVVVTAVNNNSMANGSATIYVDINSGLSNADSDAWDVVSVSDVGVSVANDDVPSFSISESSGATTVVEGSQDDDFTIVLGVQPVSDVVISLIPNDSSIIVVPPTVTFNALNWNIPQTVSVIAVDDSNTTDESPNIAVSIIDASSDDDWDSLADQYINVSVTDDDIVPVPGTPPVTPTPDPSTGSGGGMQYCNDIITINCREHIVPLVLSSETVNTPNTKDDISCKPAIVLERNLSYGKDNDPEIVRRVQTFLVVYAGIPLEVNGIYDKKTAEAVRIFQETYMPQTFGLGKPTGVVYRSTIEKMSELECQKIHIKNLNILSDDEKTNPVDQSEAHPLPNDGIDKRDLPYCYPDPFTESWLELSLPKINNTLGCRLPIITIPKGWWNI